MSASPSTPHEEPTSQESTPRGDAPGSAQAFPSSFGMPDNPQAMRPTVTGRLEASSAAGTTASIPERANKWAVLALVGVAAFMNTLDASIVNISLPSIARAFGVAATGAVEWVIIGYLVVTAALLLTCGRLADMIGRKPLFVAGLAIFTLGSALCGAAPSLGVLVAARCFQGVGAALIFAVNTAMITSTFPAMQRGQALGINAILVALGVSAGPTIGGFITEHFTWRWIFYVNVPIGIVVLLAALAILTERSHWKAQRFDPAGAALLAVGLAALTLGLSFGQEWGWTSWRLVLMLAVSLAALAAVVPVERRMPAPILDVGLLRTRAFALANISFVIAMLALFAVSYLLPFYFEQLRGFDTQQSGLLLTPLSLTLVVVAPISGALADHVGSRWLAPGGLAIACLGLLLLSQLNATSSLVAITLPLVVTGVGQGLFQSPNTRSIMSVAPRNEQGQASGVLSTGRVVGQSLSVALAGAVFAAFGGASAGSLLDTQRQTYTYNFPTAQVDALQETFVGALHAAFLVCAALAGIGVVTALARGREKPARSG